MIRLEHLQKRYPEFDMDLELEVEAGELISILGPSGSGKTTILRLIAGFEQPDAGRIFINGEDVTALRPAERRIGYVFQDYTLFPHMDVGANIGYGLRVRGEPPERIARRVNELLELMELSGYAGRRVDTLSGGERQRVAIARALAVDPVLLMLDEPFSSIDEVLRRDLRREIVRLQKELGITVLFVTHSRPEALSISNRVAILRQGRLVQYGSPVELYRNPSDEFVAGFVGEVSFVEEEGRRFAVRPEGVTLLAPRHRAGGTRDAGVKAGEAGASTGEPPSWELAVRVESRQFLGFSWLYELRHEQGILLAYDERRFAEGTELRALPAGAVDATPVASNHERGANTVHEFYESFAHLPGRYEWCRIHSTTHPSFDCFIVIHGRLDEPVTVYVSSDAGEAFMRDRYPESEVIRVSPAELSIRHDERAATHVVTGELRANGGPVVEARMEFRAPADRAARAAPYGSGEFPVWGSRWSCEGVDLELDATLEGYVRRADEVAPEAFEKERAVLTLGSYGRIAPLPR